MRVVSSIFHTLKLIRHLPTPRLAVIMASSQRKPSFPAIPSPIEHPQLPSSHTDPPPPPQQPHSTAFQHRINDEAFHSTAAQSEAMSVEAGAVSSPSPHPSLPSPQTIDCPSCSTSTTYRAFAAQRQQDRHVYGGSVTLSILCKHGRLLHRFSAVSDWGAAMRGRDDAGEVLSVEIMDEGGGGAEV